MAFRVKYQIKSKIILSNKTIEKIQIFNHSECNITFNYDRDLSQERYKF